MKHNSQCKSPAEPVRDLTRCVIYDEAYRRVRWSLCSEHATSEAIQTVGGGVLGPVARGEDWGICDVCQRQEECATYGCDSPRSDGAFCSECQPRDRRVQS